MSLIEIEDFPLETETYTITGANAVFRFFWGDGHCRFERLEMGGLNLTRDMLLQSIGKVNVDHIEGRVWAEHQGDPMGDAYDTARDNREAMG